MKLSLQWLSDFVAFTEVDPQKIAEKLTLGTAEVEQVEAQGSLLKHCVVGKVLTVDKHPNANSLFLCDVQTEQGKKRVVCGGTNLEGDMLIAFAHVGAKVRWHGEGIQELSAAKIRGEKSEGMICAAEELDLQHLFSPKPEDGQRPILDLGRFRGEKMPQVGQPLAELLGLTDTIFHINNTAITTRPDLFSHVGFARECVALKLGSWKKKPEWILPKFPTQKSRIRIQTDDPELAPRYLGCMLTVEGIGETPDWMRTRLEAVGLRSLNLAVDITNYVAQEVGVPLHSFDADDIQGEVHMRLSKKNETITTFDRVERKLPEGALILSDDRGIFDLLGIMGGLRSSTKESTKNIYLHAACLHPTVIRRTVQEMGHRTDASTVYEKGVPPIVTTQGFTRALQLFLELLPGTEITSELETFGSDGVSKVITLSPKKVTTYLGRETSAEEISSALEPLGFSVMRGKGENTLEVSSPLHRLGDIHEAADLIEEIARISGLEGYAPELPVASITLPTRDRRLTHLRETLKELRCTEFVQLAFVGENLLKQSGFHLKNLNALQNPLGEDFKYVRPSLLPRLLEAAQLNKEHEEATLQLFEIGRVASNGQERTELTLLIVAKEEKGPTEEPFHRAKALTQEIAHALGVSLQFLREKTSDPKKHPSRSAEILHETKRTGELFELHPILSKHFGFPGRVAVATLSLDVLLQKKGQEKRYRAIPLFPSIVYDTTVSVEDAIEVEGLLKKTQGMHPLLSEIRLIDLFQKGTKERKLTFRCTYNAPDRTLREDEVKPVHEKVELILKSFSA